MADFNSVNTFEAPDTVAARAVEPTLSDGIATLTVNPASVTVFRVSE